MTTKKKSVVAAHDLDRIIVRLPDGMRQKIADLADVNNRSMTAEVVAAIEQHLKAPHRLSAIESFIEKHREDIEAISTLWKAGEALENAVRDLEENANFKTRTKRILS